MTAEYLLSTATGFISQEILDATSAPAADSAAGRDLRTGGYKTTQTLTHLTSPALKEGPLVKEVTISGTQTIDFTSAPQQADRTADMSTYRVLAFCFRAPTGNSAAITVAPGSANPYALRGAGNSFDINPGEQEEKTIEVGATPALPVVSGTVKTIDISGTNGDKLEVEIHFGL